MNAQFSNLNDHTLFLESVILTVDAAYVLMRCDFAEVKGNLDVCNSLACLAYGYKHFNIYLRDLMHRCLDKNPASIQQTAAVILMPCVIEHWNRLPRKVVESPCGAKGHGLASELAESENCWTQSS